jgi:hypothetical protein
MAEEHTQLSVFTDVLPELISEGCLPRRAMGSNFKVLIMDYVASKPPQFHLPFDLALQHRSFEIAGEPVASSGHFTTPVFKTALIVLIVG